MIYADPHYEKNITFNLKILYARPFLIIGLKPEMLNRETASSLIGNFSFCILFFMANILRRRMESLFKHSLSLMLLKIQIKSGSGSATDFFFSLFANFSFWQRELIKKINWCFHRIMPHYAEVSAEFKNSSISNKVNVFYTNRFVDTCY